MDDSQATARIRENLDWCKLARESGIQAPEDVAMAEERSDRLGPRTESELAATDRNRFIELAYMAVLGRPPSQKEILHQARLLRFLPFICTRHRFLTRLRGCWEAIDRRTQERRVHEAEVLMRLRIIEQRQEQSRLQLKALFSAVTELGSEIMADLRDAPAFRDRPESVPPPVRERRLSQEGPPCAS